MLVVTQFFAVLELHDRLRRHYRFYRGQQQLRNFYTNHLNSHVYCDNITKFFIPVYESFDSNRKYKDYVYRKMLVQEYSN